MGKGKIVFACLTTLSILVLSIYFLGPVISSRQATDIVQNRGSIKAIGVEIYSDSACTTKLSTVDWGVLEPGAKKNVTIYVRNEGNSAVTLSMSASNWNPSNTYQYLTLTWDYGGKSIAPKEVVKLTLKLAVSAGISGITDFSFDVTIIGTG